MNIYTWLFKQLLAGVILTSMSPHLPPLSIAPVAYDASLGGLEVVQNDPQHIRTYPAAKAEKLYYAVCYAVAQQVRPEHPERVMPNPHVILRLGTEKKGARIIIAHVGDKNVWTVELDMPKWDEDSREDESYFARGVGIAAGVSVVKVDMLLQLADTAQSQVDSQVSVEELQNEKK